jgi:ribosomal protein S18 acetylase RimI-like enzyme
MAIRLALMPAARIAEWIVASEQQYALARMGAGDTAEQARDTARRSTEENFPGGIPLPTHRVFDIIDGADADADAVTGAGTGDGAERDHRADVVVGYLWIGPKSDGDNAWWVFDIEVHEHYRRRGFARRALELGHSEAKRLGATAIGLNVFAETPGAQKLYESLGYRPTAVQMRMPL